MRWIYTIVIYLLVPVFVLRLVWRSRRAPLYRARLRERLGYFKNPNITRSIWIHAVSYGETIAVTPYIKALQARYPDLSFVVTSTTPTGSARVQAEFGQSVFHVYAPYDTPTMVQRFLKKIKPVLFIMVETELWPNYLYYCDHFKIKTLVMNARLSERSMNRYLRYKMMTQSMMKHLSLVIAQFDADAERFVRLGVPASRVMVAGNIKFDVPVPEKMITEAKLLRETFDAQRPVWVAASTHEGEEALLLEAHARILLQHPSALLILVPRHADRFQAVRVLSETRFVTVTRSSREPVQVATQVLLGDTLGELMLFYATADVAFVGGSLFAERGGHNLLEPAALAKPVLSGPHVRNFLVIADLLQKAQGLIYVKDVNNCAVQVAELFLNKKRAHEVGLSAYSVVEKNRGALARQVAKTCELLEN